MSNNFQYPLTGIATTLAIAQCTYFAFAAGKARMKAKLKAPRTEGDEEYEVRNRIHYNNLENLSLFLPGLWLNTIVTQNDTAGGAAGLIWVAGRGWFAYGYPEKRSGGFIVSQLTQIGLCACSLYHFAKLAYNKLK